MAELERGDVVQLKSGGPRMTVMTTGGAGATGSIACVWHDVEGKVHREWFYPEMLESGEHEHTLKYRTGP
jgi:uncharacterized protein YodC (DUF2158 family)